MIDRTKFFDGVRGTLFNGNLTQDHVDGMGLTLDLWEQSNQDEIAGLAYIFATNWWEARLPPGWRPRMQPVEEVGRGEGKPYGAPDPQTGHIYYGRGDVQLTWADNYKRLGNRVGIDIYHDPSLALDRTHSKKILVIGMIEGLYTPHAGPLSTYFPKGGPFRWEDARKMVNGSDKKADIAALGRKFHTALQTAEA